MNYKRYSQGTALAPYFKCGKFLRPYVSLGLSETPTRAQIWSATQRITLCLAKFCADRKLAPDVTATIFDVCEPCSTHEQAALLGARNLVDTYTSLVNAPEVKK